MLALHIDHLSHAYGDRVALDGLSLEIEAGEIFGLLGPNGSGKTTLFRILSTLIPAKPAAVRVFGKDLATEKAAVRRMMGVVFQSPSLDLQLSARENLRHQGHLYGLGGGELKKRIDETLAAFGLADRADDRVKTFSGGMRRRVDVAKGLLHRPRLLLLDEPSTGLDPAARLELWQMIQSVSRQDGVTVLITTHLMEEADKCDRLGILAGGKLLAAASPAELKAQIGGDVITMTTADPDRLVALLNERFAADARIVDGVVRVERREGHRFVPDLIETAPDLVDSISVGKPTLEDVFIQLAGRGLRVEAATSR